MDTFNIVRIVRQPGFREVVELLDQLALQAKDDAFNASDDSRAMRLLHEGRGATHLVTRFKSEIERMKQEQENNIG
jgi:hypothetical protein